ncbi:MAG: autotransporter-associated beta strand repeat-containing protein [Luteolibacter sp.]
MKSKRFPFFAVMRAAIFTAASSGIAFAADGNWTSVAISGNWADSGNWDLGNIADGSGATANFTRDITALTTVTNDGRTIGNIVFSDNALSDSAWVITGSTLTLAGGSTITTITDTTIGSNVAGTGFTKAGTGTLTLSSTSNSFSGGVTLGAGTLQIAAATNLPSGNTLTFTGGTLNTTAAMTLANSVLIASGQSGTIKAPTSGLLTLTGNYSGVAGTMSLDLTASNSFGGIAIGSATGPVAGSIVNVLGTTSANNTQIDLRPAGAVTFFKDSKVVISASGAGLTLFGLGNAGSGRNYQFGALDGGSATTQIQSDNASSTLTINGLTSGNYSGVITNGSGGSIALVKTGSATQTFSGTNTYTGTTTINGGTLAISTAANLSTSSALTFTNNAILNTTAALTLANNVVIASGQSGTIKVANASTVLSGNYTGMVGTLTLDMSAVSGFAGITSTSASNGPAGTVNVIGGPGSNQTQLGGAGGTFWANTILTFGSGNVYMNGTTTSWTFGALSGGSVGAGNLGTKIGFDNNSGKTITIKGIADANFGGVIFNGSGTSGANNLLKQGSATQTLSGTNTYTGTSTIDVNGGTLQFANSVSFYNSTSGSVSGANAQKLVVNSGGASAFNVGGTGFTITDINTLLTNSSATVGFKTGSTLGLDTTNGDFTYGNAITNTLADTQAIGLTKLGANTLTLTGANTYTGTTTVAAGILAVNGSALADTAKLVISGGKVEPTGTEVVGSLFFGLDQQASGTWGTVASGADHQDDSRFSGTGKVNVIPVAGGYASWKITNAPTGTPSDDYDGDGVSNGVEFILGGLASTNDLAKLPAPTIVGSNLIFTFVRDDAAAASPGTTVQIEVGTTLATWPDVYTVGVDTASSTAGVTVTDYGTTDTVTVTLTIPQAPDAAKFARLKVRVTP